MKISDSVGYTKKTTPGNPDTQIIDEPIEISKPLTGWFGLLILAVIIELVVAPYFPSLSNIMVKFSNYVLYLPGAIILPLIVAVWLGERAGSITVKSGRILRLSIINSLYTAIVYAIGIFIIYLIFLYVSSVGLSTIKFNDFLIYLVAIPIGILLILTPIVAILAGARRTV
ncbi:MAG: hypothetical protein M1385_00900 [Candidatus Marsarchaeota archaeon]|nr:hypothetical protein [Candidatus Marsarchaeota archaeon]